MIFTLDPSILKISLFGCIAKFEKYPGVAARAFQLLQDCHLLAPPGVTHEELAGRYDAVLRCLSSWLTKLDVVLNMFQVRNASAMLSAPMSS